MTDEDTRLDEFDKDEWYEVYKQFKPQASQEEYDRDWDEFQKRKAEHERQKGLH